MHRSLYARVIRDKAMGEDPDELGRFATSPLRAANLDLCERLATRVAARELCVDGDLSPAQARRLEECLERLESSEPSEPEAGPTDDIHAALAAKLETMTRVDALGGHARRRGLARRWLESLADEALADGVREPVHALVARVVREVPQLALVDAVPVRARAELRLARRDAVGALAGVRVQRLDVLVPRLAGGGPVERLLLVGGVELRSHHLAGCLIYRRGVGASSCSAQQQ